MRVAFIQDHLRNGGTENQTIHTAESLAKAGIDTHLIVFRRGGVLDDKATNSSFTLHFLKQGLLKTDWHAPRLAKTIDDIAPDIVIAMGKMANCRLGLISSKSRPYKLISTFRTGKKIPFLYLKALRQCDHILANSNEALRRIHSTHKINRPQNVSVIYNGCIRDFETTIPTLQPSSSVPTFHMVCVSMFRPEKKQINLIRICSQLPPEIEWKLTLAGNGPCLVNCQREAQTLGIADRIEFPGLLKDPRSLYAQADIAVHTSERESLPNFLVEAQMAGLPIVAYDTGGVGECFIQAGSGFLIQMGDQLSFLNRIKELAQNEPMRLQMSQAAQEYAHLHFTLQAQLQSYQKLFSKLVT
ncbi:glycosyltransferase [Puniceicoccaceae bacterium K14]|nr:glycosyltransferase [Puniceicoccaceae bacterium K14]